MIRHIKADDFAEVLDMVAALTAFHDETGTITMETLIRDVAGPHPWVHVLVAQGENGLDGYAALLPFAQFHDGVRSMNLHHLYVRDTQRGTGLGRKLIDAAIKFARDLQCWFEQFQPTSPQFRLSLT